jgi:ribonuclease P protein subunit RPR2
LARIVARRRNKQAERALARRRMERLLALADEEASARPDRTRRYVDLARRIGMRYQEPLPRAWRGRVCRGCGDLLVAGLNARVRLRAGHRSVTCEGCGRVARRPLAVRQEGAT